MHKALLLFAALIIQAGLFAHEDEAPRARFEDADANSDGIIQVDEVQRMIDGFFIGTHDHGVMYIHSLIDHFYEQDEYK